MELLSVLWSAGPLTVRDVQDELLKTKKVAYTSVATIMRVLHAKKMVEIVDARRPQKFRAVISEEAARKLVTDEWLSRMFNGSILSFVRHAFVGRRCTAAQIKEMKRIVDDSRE